MDNIRDTFDWWAAKTEQKMAEQIHDYLQWLEQNQGYRSTRNMRNIRLYGNFDVNSFQSYSYARKETSTSNQNRVTLNVVRSMIDTVTAKITKNSPVPTFLTSGGDWNAQQKAKDLSKFIEGQFYATDLYEKRAFTFKDGCIFGTGAIKIYKENKDIKVERVFPEEIVIDDVEGFYGNPRQMHQTKFIHKDALIARFPNSKGAIETYSSSNTGYKDLRPRHSDLVLVVESWKKASSPGVDDGRHAITIEKHTLSDEKYDKTWFPFVFDRWNRTPYGFYGQGLADQLEGLQLEINKILRTIQISMHLVSIPKIFLEAGSKVVDSHLNNKIGGVIRYAGTPPTPGQLGVIPRELFSHLDYLYNRAYEITGVSQLSAQSNKPSGLNSGKALRIYNDLESERFLDVAKRYEQGFLDAAAIMIEYAKELDLEYKSEGGYEVMVHGRNSVRKLKWQDVNLKEDQYVMKMYPASALSSSPAGRLQEVQELMEAGLVGRDEGLKLLDMPDLENFYTMSTAALADIEKQIDMIIQDSKYQTPEPFQDLEQGIKRFQAAYLHYKAQGAPDSKLELLRRWMSDANDLLQQSVNAQTAPVPTAPLPVESGVPADQVATGPIIPQDPTQVDPATIDPTIIAQ